MAAQKCFQCFLAGTIAQRLKCSWPFSNKILLTVLLKQLIFAGAHARAYEISVSGFAQQCCMSQGDGAKQKADVAFAAQYNLSPHHFLIFFFFLKGNIGYQRENRLCLLWTCILLIHTKDIYMQLLTHKACFSCSDPCDPNLILSH